MGSFEVKLASAVLAGIFATASGQATAGDHHRWSGVYIGINGGGGWWAGDRRIELFTDDTTPVNLGDATAASRGIIGDLGRNGIGFGGIQLGYNWQFGSLVVGAETDIQLAIAEQSVSGTFSNPDGTFPTDGFARREADYFGTVRGRLGWTPVKNWLIYATGGWAYSDIKYSFEAIEQPPGDLFRTSITDRVRSGWVVGGGLEVALSSNISLKAEYQYLDFGDLGGSAPVVLIANGAATGETASLKAIDTEIHTFRLGLNYKLGARDYYEPLK